MPTSLAPDTTALLDALPDAALVVDRDGVVVFANRHAATLLGAPYGELAGTVLERRLAESPGGRVEVRRADGTTVTVDVRRALLEGATGALSLVTIRDRSEYAQLVDAARDAEDRYRMVVTSASEVFYRIRMSQDSMRGIVEFVSPQCERLTGLPPSAFMDNAALWIECIHPDDRAVLFQTTQEILQEGREGSRYYRIRNSVSGEYRWVADRVVPLYDARGHVTGYQGVARDITDRRRAEQDRQRLGEELRQAQKMEAIGRLASGVAHDFNNLVTIILASCDAARAAGTQAELVDASLDEIVDAGNRASVLTKQLLTVSHEQPSAPRVLDLSAQLLSSRALLRRMLPDAVELQWALDKHAWPVLLDESHLDQVLFNLVANARDAMPDGGCLTIGTSNVTCLDEPLAGVAGLPIGDYVQLAVTDTGAGMDAATIAHAFEPFYTTKAQGTGLGLASVYGIVKQAHGDIHIESEPALGTRVVIHFPRVAVG
jgi:hypothetical protein